MLISSCGGDAEKSARIERWIREADSMEAVHKRTAFVADSAHNADSAALAEEIEIYRMADSAYDAEY